MHWLLTPYDKHSDEGFGAMASAFKASAETLIAAEKDSISHRELRRVSCCGTLPNCFLNLHLLCHTVLSLRTLNPIPLFGWGTSKSH